MNPFGVILVLLGFVLIVIGFKGSQHRIMADLKGVRTTKTGFVSGSK
jgi:hypothetical protein